MEHKDITYADQKIVGVQMGKRVQKSFIEYAMSVIVSRALPDVRDGLKPVHRRILYSMYENHLTYDRPFCKSATTVGNVLGRYHPHGDAAVYDSMVRLAQPFTLRYPLVEGHGNFGNVDGDGAAAYRYTEARMSKMASELLTDIDKNVVPFTPNFDNSTQEPEVLPAGFPNLLVNGSVGIAVGMATNVPPHNLAEVIDGTVYLIKNPDATVPELMNYIKGPDFPTSAIICGTSGIYSAYSTGRGRIIVRARARVEEEHRRIIVTEIPYQVNKGMLVKSIADLVKDKRVEGITELRDESGKAGMRIVIEYSRAANGQVILNQLYKYTQLQDTCAVNMIALVDGEPKTLGLKEILSHYIKHRENVVRRRVTFDLEKTQARVHILEGQKIALDNIERVIKTIRSSESVPEARDALMANFGLSAAQAQAIVDMTLGKLAGLERFKIEDELAAKEQLLKELSDILANEPRLLEIVAEELTALKDRFADVRRTEIAAPIDDIIDEDLIEKHECVITMTHTGYIKRCAADTYTAQRRGGKGIKGMDTKEEDYVENVMIVHSHSSLLLFTNFGKVYMIKAYRVPEAQRTAKGTNIANLVELAENEKVTSAIALKSFNDDEYFVMVTKNGVVKRSGAKDFEYQRKGGKIAINLDENDELLFVKRTDGQRDVIIATRDGKASRFNENEARVLGRTARGVRGIRLKGDDRVIGVAVVEDGKKLCSVTENGFGKRSDFDGFAAHSRGTTGVFCHKVNAKTGKLMGIASVFDDDDIMIITDDGTIIRTSVSEIPVYSNNTSGVRVMKMYGDAKAVNFALIKSEKQEDEELTEAEKELLEEDVPSDVSDEDEAEENEENTEDNGDEEI